MTPLGRTRVNIHKYEGPITHYMQVHFIYTTANDMVMLHWFVCNWDIPSLAVHQHFVAGPKSIFKLQPQFEFPAVRTDYVSSFTRCQFHHMRSTVVVPGMGLEGICPTSWKHSLPLHLPPPVRRKKSKSAIFIIFCSPQNRIFPRHRGIFPSQKLFLPLSHHQKGKKSKSAISMIFKKFCYPQNRVFSQHGGISPRQKLFLPLSPHRKRKKFKISQFLHLKKKNICPLRHGGIFPRLEALTTTCPPSLKIFQNKSFLANFWLFSSRLNFAPSMPPPPKKKSGGTTGKGQASNSF